MTKTEAIDRMGKASARIGNANPITAFIIAGLVVVSWMFRTIVHLCIGFGAMSMLHLSLWWGFPVALLSGMTLGRAYEWARRDARVRDYEQAADLAEKQARGEK